MTSNIDPAALATGKPSLTMLRQQLYVARNEITALQVQADRSVQTMGQRHVAVGKSDADVEQATLYALVIPGGAMGPADTLRVSGAFSAVGGALQTYSLYLGEVAIWSWQGVMRLLPFDLRVAGRSSVTSQVAFAVAPRSAAALPTTIDFGVDQVLALRFRWGDAGDGSGVAVLESVTVERIRGA